MNQAMIQLSRPLIGQAERDAVLEILDSGHLVQGRRVEELEAGFRALTGAPEAVAVSSGTAGLFLALLAHGIVPGDHVVTSPFSFVATANAILMTGATPVFADIEPTTFNISAETVKRVLTTRTRAVLPVHIFGRMCPMAGLRELAAEVGAVVIEDAAQAVGALDDGRPPGYQTTAVYSLYATKTLMSGEGGLVTTSDAGVADRLRLLRNHGMRERYVYEGLGYNLRMTDLQAALGVAQLARLPELLGARRANASELSRRLRGVGVPESVAGHAWHQYTVRLAAGRDQAIAELRRHGVATGVFYPLGLHQIPHVAAAAGGPQSLPGCEAAAEQVLSLPVHPQLGEHELARIVAAVNSL